MNNLGVVMAAMATMGNSDVPYPPGMGGLNFRSPKVKEVDPVVQEQKRAIRRAGKEARRQAKWDKDHVMESQLPSM
jgi:hypothetical protein